MQKSTTLATTLALLALLTGLAALSSRATTHAGRDRDAAGRSGRTAADGPRAPDQCPAPRPVTPISSAFFTDISEASGIRDENFVPNPPAPIPINDHSRLAFADINGDGWDDIVMHSLFPNPRAGIPFEHLVFLNNSDNGFTNFSDESGLRNIQAGFFLFGDVDNDGDQDAFAGLDIPLAGQGHRILLNDGTGRFTEKPLSGVNMPFQDQNGNVIHYAGNAVFADLDGDADLDLYVGNGQSSAAVPDQVFIGNGDGSFTYEPSRLKGPTIARASNGTVTCDYDRDGDQDIFVSVYGISIELGHNLLWENDGRGFFTNVARERGFEALATGNYYLAETGHGRDPEPGKAPGQFVGGNGFGLQCEDMTNDGLPDIFITNISHPNATDYNRTWSDPSEFLVNQGPQKGFAFVNEWLDRGLPFNEGDVDGGAVDFDNDGYVDLSISRDSKYEPSYTTPDQRAWFGLMHQRPDGTFESVGLASGINDTAHDPPALGRMKAAQNHAWSDIDHDGDLDLLVGGRTNSATGRPNFLFQNEIGSRNDWLAIRLEGDGQRVNRDAIGTRVELVYPDEVLRREVKSSRGMYNSMDTRALHFGLGARGCDYQLKVTWPDGTVQTMAGAEVGRNRWLTLRYGEQEPTATPAPTATTTPPGTGGDITMTGWITDTVSSAPIAGATVAISVCVPHQPFQGTSGADGRYSVLLPAQYANLCESVSIEARAAGYATHQETATVAELRANPRRDYRLAPAATPTPPGTPPTPTPTPSPTPTTHIHFIFQGTVRDGTGGGQSPLPGANVAVGTCHCGTFGDETDADGKYEVVGFTNSCVVGCGTILYTVSAPGFETLRLTAPEPPTGGPWTTVYRDFTLVRQKLYLPILRHDGPAEGSARNRPG